MIWHSEIRYLGVHLIAAREYRCSHSKAKQPFYKSFNAVFGKVGRCASLDVIVELQKTKCLPSLLYGIEACPVNMSLIRSLKFVINNAFRKIFATKSCDIANECVLMFNCSVYDMEHKRKSKFLNELEYNENTLCKMFQVELSELSALYCT